eukprot:4354785-Ditylum_brightwellii.AAC.1
MQDLTNALPPPVKLIQSIPIPWNVSFGDKSENVFYTRREGDDDNDTIFSNGSSVDEEFGDNKEAHDDDVQIEDAASAEENSPTETPKKLSPMLGSLQKKP